MKKLKILMVEDQPKYVESFSIYSKGFADEIDIQNLCVASSLNEAKNIILTEDKRFDLTILDYYLDGSTCFQLLEETKDKIRNYGRIAFTTKDETELKRFKTFGLAVSYLFIEKPFDEFQIKQLLEDYKQNIGILVEPETISIKLINGPSRKININSLLFVQSSKKYSFLYIMNNGNIEELFVDASLIDHERKLEQFKRFIRVSNTHIVNPDKVVIGKKEDRYSGWLSFLNEAPNPISNPYTATYSRGYVTFELLKKVLKMPDL